MQTSNQRPEISSIQNGAESNPIEAFQNQCLRPIIKQIHHQILFHFSICISLKHKGKYFETPEDQKANYILKVLNTDQNYKLELKGMILGHFTEQEFQIYANNYKKIDKRIFSIVTERILTNQQDLKKIY
ncbi:hypothetical protein QYS48_26185 [Marivirga arenosa]|uniref:Glyoxalase n=1 Tax=Marivirga arenosa TaxID=3059076 RepID=A0AA49JAY5_9BACT|nr:hypothetical protein [Marivirga sp. ABR2-2]WKK85373.2 hypothetical protein QYS48_26185 [Marivirga sp. ABR2-2]